MAGRKPEELIAAFDENMDDLQDIISRSVATDDIEEIYRMGYNALYVMDKIVNPFATTSAAFVAGYKHARIIVDNAGGRKKD